MPSNRTIESCLVAITLLLAFAALRPVFSPAAARAKSHYEYQLVQVDHADAEATLSKLTNQGWEPVGMSYYYTAGGQLGYFLFRR